MADDRSLEMLHNDSVVSTREYLSIQLSGLIDRIESRFSEIDTNYERRLQDIRNQLENSLREIDLRYQQRFDAQQKALADALAAQEKATATALTAAKEAVTAALTAADRAVTKAEISSDKRFESVNEFRAVLTAQSATLATKEELASMVKTWTDKLDLITRSLTEKLDSSLKSLTDKIDGPSGVARQFEQFRSAAAGRAAESSASNLHENQTTVNKNQSLVLIVTISFGLIMAVIAAVSLLSKIK